MVDLAFCAGLQSVSSKYQIFLVGVDVDIHPYRLRNLLSIQLSAEFMDVALNSCYYLRKPSEIFCDSFWRTVRFVERPCFLRLINRLKASLCSPPSARRIAFLKRSPS